MSHLILVMEDLVQTLVVLSYLGMLSHLGRRKWPLANISTNLSVVSHTTGFNLYGERSSKNRLIFQRQDIFAYQPSQCTN
jgi:hypothetical protein